MSKVPLFAMYTFFSHLLLHSIGFAANISLSILFISNIAWKDVEYIRDYLRDVFDLTLRFTRLDF